MHNIHAGTRKTVLSALVALAVLASTLLSFAPPASANREDCPAGSVCLWSGPTYGGQQAFFNGEDTGWHTLSNIDPESGWNHTGNHNVIFQETTTLFPG
jgi:hypothetical protein